MAIKHDTLIVSETFNITSVGTDVLFEGDPPALFSLGPVFVVIATPHGDEFKAEGSVEAVRKIPPGEALAMLFRDLNASEIPVGSNVQILESSKPLT